MILGVRLAPQVCRMGGSTPPTRKVGLAPAVNRAPFSLHTDNRG